MTLFASILFLLTIILYDEYKIHREKKRVAPESQKRIKEFNNYMERLKEIQNSKQRSCGVPLPDIILNHYCTTIDRQTCLPYIQYLYLLFNLYLYYIVYTIVISLINICFIILKH